MEFTFRGGIKLSLENGGIHFNKNITSEDFPIWTQGELSNILNNPCYAFGIFFDPIDLFFEWQKVFIYQVAILSESIPIKYLENIYEEFLEFIKNEVCKWIECPKIVLKKQGMQVLEQQIIDMRDYLKAQNQSLISKNNIITIGNNIFICQYYKNF